MISSSVASCRNGGKALENRTKQGKTGKKKRRLVLAGKAAHSEVSLLTACLATLRHFGIGYCNARKESSCTAKSCRKSIIIGFKYLPNGF